MKIAILTLSLNPNYGNILQAYALFKYLVRLGNEVKLIDKRFKPPNQIRTFISRYVLGNFRLIEKTKTRISKKMMSFAELRIDKSPIIYNIKDLINYCNEEEFDAIVVGSDQVWRLDYIQNQYEVYFLSFVDDLVYNPIRISYAASFGKDFFLGNESIAIKIKESILKFRSISVRENSGINICKELFGYVNAETHIDPTMLLTQSDYQKIYSNFKDFKEDYVLTYYLDNNNQKMEYSQGISKDHNFSIRTINSLKYFEQRKVKRGELIGIEDWLDLFANSKCILTDSFHGMVFAIIFNKPFVVFGNKIRGLSRFNSLLKILNLEFCLITGENPNYSILSMNYSWDSVNMILTREREKSRRYFFNALNLK